MFSIEAPSNIFLFVLFLFVFFNLFEKIPLGLEESLGLFNTFLAEVHVRVQLSTTMLVTY